MAAGLAERRLTVMELLLMPLPSALGSDGENAQIYEEAPRFKGKTGQINSPPRIKPRPITFTLHYWLVLASFLVIQLMNNHLQDDEFHLVMRFKFQITRYIC